MTKEELTSALSRNGFRQYTQQMPINHTGAESHWQIRVIDSTGNTLYFINAHVYDVSRINNGLDYQVEFESDLYFLNTETSIWATVTFHGTRSESDVEQALLFFERAYGNLNCRPDPLNN